MPLLNSQFHMQKKRRECLAFPCFLPAPRLGKSKGLCIFWSCLISSGLPLRTTALKWKLSNMIDGVSFYLQAGNIGKNFFHRRSYCLLVQELFPLCRRIDLQHWCMSLYIFLTGPSQSISQQVFRSVMDYVARSFLVMFPLKG